MSPTACPDQQHCAICATGVMCCLDTRTSEAMLDLRTALFAEIGHGPSGSADQIKIEIAVRSDDRPPAALPSPDDDDDVVALFIQSPEEEPCVEIACPRPRR